MLTQQLKMLKGRTAQPWVYVGESDQAELLIVRSRDEHDERAQVHQRVGAQLEPARSIEWPLRLFGLLELLVEYEKQPQLGEAAVVELCEQLAGLSAESLYRISDTLIIVPRDDLVLTRHADFDAALQCLAAAGADLKPEVLVPLGELSQFPQRFSFKSLLWSLALVRGERVGGDLRATDATFRLGAWPLLSEWQSSPPLLRLAALYTRQFASIERGVAFSGASREQVQAFLFACKCCGIGLEAQVERQAVPVAAPAEKTLLQRLRLRLGLGYGKSRQA
ncbi:hypothetical protein K5Q02_01465 [Pseudomonas sp. MM211]|uniref:hypothetical protein n=1 Tax=Pseudomonas sp. MM211 TaxID=2866808 RepID=UPI001CED43BF|nr:hypothetical protein [Pseudomonas sp. MM211]UCJ17099.1 hypothetical protein K5Q02_01465 [Pseudomonas sp. MM211]